jgi:hypothetical protein
MVGRGFVVLMYRCLSQLKPYRSWVGKLCRHPIDDKDEVAVACGWGRKTNQVSAKVVLSLLLSSWCLQGLKQILFARPFLAERIDGAQCPAEE